MEKYFKHDYKIKDLCNGIINISRSLSLSHITEFFKI